MHDVSGKEDCLIVLYCFVFVLCSPDFGGKRKFYFYQLGIRDFNLHMLDLNILIWKIHKEHQI